MSLRPALRAVAGLSVLAIFLLAVSSAAAAPPDRLPPTKPGNLRVTAKTQTSVSLAWNPSTDNSGNFTYQVHLAYQNTVVTLPKTQTSYTWAGLRPNVQYYFWVIAIDAAGNKAFSNQVTVTTNRDTTPPPAPTNLRVTGVTSSQISLAWDASPDNTGILEYHLNVSPSGGAYSWTGPTSVTIQSLAPSATYTISVRARDFGYNNSPFSAPVSATTLASTDTQAQSAPANLYVQDWGCEVELNWTKSTDNQEPQSAIRYQVYINGTFDHEIVGLNRTITYGITDGNNVFVVRAKDSAGNLSGPSNSFTSVLDC